MRTSDRLIDHLLQESILPGDIMPEDKDVVTEETATAAYLAARKDKTQKQSAFDAAANAAGKAGQELDAANAALSKADAVLTKFHANKPQ